jgi:diguanylate cyclase (GGDEF)-like protein/PAS domain S-box-containing protein
MSDGLAPDTIRYQHLLMERLPAILAYWDTDLRCRFANHSYKHWFGVSTVDLVGTSLGDLLGPELLALNEPHIKAALQGHEQTFERDLTGPDGTSRQSLVTYLPDVVDGTVVGFLVNVTDVTSIKVAQASLQRSEEYLRALFALAAEGVVVTDTDGRYVDVNQACCDMLGYTRDDILGKSFDDLLCTSELPRLPEARAQLHAGHRHVEEWMLRRKDGSTLPVEVRAKFLPDGRRVGFLRDITEHKRALDAEHELAAQLDRRVKARTAELELAGFALRRGKARLRGIFDSAKDAILSLDESQRIVEANPAAAQMLRLPIEELIGSPLDRFIPERSRARHRREVETFGDETLSARHMASTRNVTGLRANGEEFPIDASISHVNIDSQRTYTAILRDTTERQIAEMALRDSEASLRRLLRLLPEAVVVISADRITYVNDAAQRLFGAHESSLLGRLALELFEPDSLALDPSRIATTQAGAPSAPMVLEQVVRADGMVRTVETTATLMDERGQNSILAVLRDVTELLQTRSALVASQAVEEELARLARLDPLTGLGNRRYFEEHLAEALVRAKRSGRPVVLMLLDLDNFKQINDTFGHAAGDETLREFARRLQQCVRATDTVARWGGDEFGLVLENSHGIGEAERVAQKFAGDLTVTFVLEGIMLPAITSSIGAAILTDGTTDASAAMLLADDALYEAKRTGRDRCVTRVMDGLSAEPSYIQVRSHGG